MFAFQNDALAHAQAGGAGSGAYTRRVPEITRVVLRADRGVVRGALGRRKHRHGIEESLHLGEGGPAVGAALERNVLLAAPVAAIVPVQPNARCDVHTANDDNGQAETGGGE